MQDRGTIPCFVAPQGGRHSVAAGFRAVGVAPTEQRPPGLCAWIEQRLRSIAASPGRNGYAQDADGDQRERRWLRHANRVTDEEKSIHFVRVQRAVEHPQIVNRSALSLPPSGIVEEEVQLVDEPRRRGERVIVVE